MTKATYDIPARSYNFVVEQIALLNKKADKLGLPHAVMTVEGEKRRTVTNEFTGVKYEKVWLIVSVTGETPKLDGWRLIACIERLESGENMARVVPGETCPVEYRSTDAHCDHCQTKRQRREVFVLCHDDGRYVQVGRNCIADFLGGKSPDGVLAWCEMILNMQRILCEAGDEDDRYGGGRYAEPTWGVDEFLTTAAIVIRRLGWVSRKMAEGSLSPIETTRENVMKLLSHPRTRHDREELERFIAEHKLHAEERDAKLAAEALKWGKALPTDKGDYIYNLGVACRLGTVQRSTMGVMASLIPAYQRHLDRENELRVERAKKTRGHVGQVGKRGEFKVTVIAMRYFESMYGVKTLVRMEDEPGNVIIWWASGEPDWLEEGQVVEIKATVKEHGEYKGTPQTIVQRVAENKGKVKAQGHA